VKSVFTSFTATFVTILIASLLILSAVRSFYFGYPKLLDMTAGMAVLVGYAFLLYAIATRNKSTRTYLAIICGSNILILLYMVYVALFSKAYSHIPFHEFFAFNGSTSTASGLISILAVAATFSKPFKEHLPGVNARQVA